MGSVSVYVRRHHVALVALFFSLSGNAVALQDENTVPSGGIEPSNVQGSDLDKADSVDTQAAVLAGISAVAKILADVPPFSREAVSVSGDGASVIALELEGAEGIESTARTPWEEPPSDARLRISRTGPGGGPQHFLITPYEFGMAIEYPGVVEAWVTDFSIHGPGHGQGGARLWVGNDDDTGGILLGARNSGTETWGEIATQKFVGTGHGPLRLRTVKTDDWVEIWSGAADSATRQVMLGTVGPAAAAGIRFGPKGDTNLHRSAADVLKTDDKLITGVGLGVGNSASATTLGSVVKKMEVFDATGASLGYVPIYDAID
jgi:hypothetical protein